MQKLFVHHYLQLFNRNQIYLIKKNQVYNEHIKYFAYIIASTAVETKT